jgi:hypothetical protein
VSYHLPFYSFSKKTLYFQIPLLFYTPLTNNCPNERALSSKEFQSTYLGIMVQPEALSQSFCFIQILVILEAQNLKTLFKPSHPTNYILN